VRLQGGRKVAGKIKKKSPMMVRGEASGLLLPPKGNAILRGVGRKEEQERIMMMMVMVVVTTVLR